LDFIAYGYPTLSIGTFGVGIGRIAISEISETTIDEDVIGKFSNSEYQIYLSYAKKLPYDITGGATVRMVRRSWSGLINEQDLNDTGFGVDLGFLYKPEWLGSPWYQDWTFGLKINNFLSPQLKEGVQEEDIPLTIKLGFMKKIRFVGGEYFTALLDFDYSSKRSMKAHIGSEYRIRNYGDIRLGFTASGLTFGGGVQYQMFTFDYAYGSNNYSDAFPGVHRISLSYDFGYNRDELYSIAEAERLKEQERLLEVLRIEEDKQFVSEHLQIANSYFESGKYFDAIVEYQQVMSRDSTQTQAQAMVDSANVLLQKGFEEAQAQALKEALDKNRAEENSAFINLHFEKGRNLLDQNQFAEALLEFNIALERDTTNSTLLTAIETTNRRITEEARSLIGRSQEALNNQDYSGALVLLADARPLAGNNTTLLRQIDAVRNQINIQQNIQKGLLLFQIDEFDKALEVFEEVLTLDPENELVLDYHRRSKIETLGQETKMDQETHKRYLAGMNEFLKGNYSIAVIIWEEILLEQPYNKKVLKAVQGARKKMEQGSE
jgi:tetratricopeptide (TPR) repeat protein